MSDKTSKKPMSRRSRPWLLVSMLILICVSAVAQETSSASSEPVVEEDAALVQTAPVVIDGMNLFSVRGVSAYPAEKRAETIAKRIRTLAADRSFSPQSLRLEESPIGTQIMAGKQFVMIVVNADARLEGDDRHVIATVYMKRISEAIDDYRQERAPDRLVTQVIYACASTSALLLGLWLGIRISRRLRSFFERRFKARVRGFQIQSFYLVEAERMWQLLNGALSFLGALVVLVACYIYLQYVLSLFPWTRGFAIGLLAILIDPLRTMGRGLLEAVPDLVFLAVLCVITYYLLKMIRLFFTAVEKGTVTLSGFDAAWGPPTYRLVRVAVIAFALVVGYPYIPGSSSQAFKGVSLFVGVVFSLGSTSLIGNMIAGYSMAFRRTFKVGDRVKIGSHVGKVEQTGLMVTYLRTPWNEMVVVPNSIIVNGDVINYSMLASNDGLILHATVGIGYETSWRQVEAMLLEAAGRTPGLLREPPPFVWQRSLGDFAVTYEINAYCNEPGAMLQLYNALHQNIQDVFNEYGVQIMTPAYRDDPEQAKIVPKDQWFTPPARPPKSEPHS